MTPCTSAHIAAVLPGNIKAIRRRSGMTQELFAAHLGLNLKAFAKYEESPGSQPSIKTCVAICKLGGVTMDALLTARLQPEPPAVGLPAAGFCSPTIKARQ